MHPPGVCPVGEVSCVVHDSSYSQSYMAYSDEFCFGRSA